MLLISRARSPEAGCWSLPGGKVGVYERTEEAARRETAEEIGISVSGLEPLCVVEYVVRDEGVHWVSPIFVAEAFDGEPALLEPDKHTGFGWFSLDGLPSPLAQSAAEAAKVLKTR